ncbi:DHR-1 domain-containing protein [Trichostrongylus colubriformis]|uniref:DHR-1 domain-containing protein n=1 Tax=Trichostrongylus colubriformis TaxID=6319 RepID=A0AAN8FX38_TRICO
MDRMTSFVAAPTQRAFVGKRNKMTAADVRKHVMTGSLMMLHPGTLDLTFPDGSSAQTLSLVDVVDPVDVEEALAQRRTSALYDISSTSNSPRNLKIAPHVRDIICSFTDQFSLVQKRYQQFSTADAYVRMLIERPIIVRSTPRPIFEADAGRAERVARSVSVVGDSDSKRQSYASTASSGTMGSAEGDSRESRLHQSQPDPTIPGVIQRSSFTQLDLLSDARRQAGRHANLVNLLPVQNDSSVIEKRSAPPYPEERVGQKLIVKVIRLSVDPFFEPIFGSIAIYDAKARRKLEKVLQACDIIDASEPYTNCAARDERTREKLAAAAADFCDRLGSFRMPLGFMVLDLQKVLSGVSTLERSEMCMSTMTAGSVGNATGEGNAPLACASETDSIVSADRVSNTSTSTFRRMGSGSSAAAVLNRVRTPLQRRKFLGGGGGTGEELLMRLSPEMLRVAPFSGGAGAELTKDIQEFPAKGFYMANTSYRNLLYIYPKSANLTNRPGTARNISIKVELMNAQEKPLRVLYSRGAGTDMVSVARTAVIYHNKTPHITDEIKLRIPVDLDDGHHLLFTFYHISCKANNKDEETEYPIGYSVRFRYYQFPSL